MTSNNLHTKLNNLSPEKRQLLALKLQAASKESDGGQKNNGKSKIVAYVKQDNTSTTDDLKVYLKKKLPDYMIPSSIIAVDEIPLLPNGKVDRSLLSKLKINRTQVSKTHTAPRNEIEEILVTIWESILKIGTIGIQDNFFEIGGDSILSIQIIAKARKEGIIIKSNQIFEYQTIAELGLFVHRETQQYQEDIYVGSVTLSPIQEWFFKEHTRAPHYWNQALRFDKLPEVDEQTIEQIAKTLITRHDALRMSFTQQNDGWKGQVRHPDQITSYKYVRIAAGDDRQAQIDQTLRDIQENITLSESSLFTCIYFLDSITNVHSCILLAHHLVIDYVSWLVVSEQFEDLIYEKTQVSNTITNTPYYKWSQDIKTQEYFENEKEYWTQQENIPLQLPLITPLDNVILEKDVVVSEAIIDSSTVQKLIEIPQNVYHTKFDEILIAALVGILSEWTNQNDITIFLERHGRESIGNEIDVANTVGWFTSFFPNTFTYSPEKNMRDHIIATKEKLRTIPNGGMGYGALKYVEKQLNNDYQPAVVFNFLGFQEKEDTQASSYFLEKELRHSSSERSYPIEINASVINGRLICKWSYPTHLVAPSQIQQLQHRFNEVLNTIIIHCTEQQETVFTPSDFPEADLSQDDLNNLLDVL